MIEITYPRIFHIKEKRKSSTKAERDANENTVDMATENDNRKGRKQEPILEPKEKKKRKRVRIRRRDMYPLEVPRTQNKHTITDHDGVQ